VIQRKVPGVRLFFVRLFAQPSHKGDIHNNLTKNNLTPGTASAEQSRPAGL
jgi:hypothetical protein